MNPQPGSSVLYFLFADCRSEEDCAWKLLNEACSRLNVQAGTFFAVDKEKQQLKVVTTHGVLPWRVAKGHFPVTEGICGWVSQHLEPALVNDVAQDSRFNNQIDLLTQFKTMSVLCVPLIVRGDLVGVLELINRHEQPFSAEDLTNLQHLTLPAATRLKELAQ